MSLSRIYAFCKCHRTKCLKVISPHNTIFFGSPLSLCPVGPSSTEGESRSCDGEGAGGNGAGEQEPLAGARDRRGLDQRCRGEIDLDVTEGRRPLVESAVPIGGGVVHGAGVCLVALKEEGKCVGRDYR